MEVGEYRGHLVFAHACAYAIRQPPLEAMLAAIAHADAVMPLFDPTAWMAGEKKMHEDEQILAILAVARRELDKLPWPESAP